MYCHDNNERSHKNCVRRACAVYPSTASTSIQKVHFLHDLSRAVNNADRRVKWPIVIDKRSPRLLCQPGQKISLALNDPPQARFGFVWEENDFCGYQFYRGSSSCFAAHVPSYCCITRAVNIVPWSIWPNENFLKLHSTIKNTHLGQRVNNWTSRLGPSLGRGG